MAVKNVRHRLQKGTEISTIIMNEIYKWKSKKKQEAVAVEIHINLGSIINKIDPEYFKTHERFPDEPSEEPVIGVKKQCQELKRQQQQKEQRKEQKNNT
jgi:hypothetical protein